MPDLELVLIVTSLLFAIITAKINKNILSAGMLIQLFFILYYAIPIYFSEALYGNSLINPIFFDESLVLCFVFILAFSLAYLASSLSKSTRVTSDSRVKFMVISQPLIFEIFVYTVAVTFLVGYWSVGAFDNIGNYGATGYARKPSSFLVQLNLVLTVLMTINLFNDNAVRRKRILITLLFTGCIVMVLGVRGVAIGIMLPFLRVFFGKMRLLVQISLASFGFIGLVLIQNFRSYKRIGIENSIARFEGKFGDNFFNIFYEQIEPFVILTRTVEYVKTEGYFYGYTFLESLVLLIPSPLRSAFGFGYECQFFCPSDWFMEYSGLSWDRGNLAFSIVAELFMNFGYFLVLPVIMIGVLLGKLDRAVRKGTNLQYIQLALLTTGLTFGFMRNDISILLKQMCYLLIIYVLISAIFTRFYHREQ